MMTLGFRGLSY